MQFFFRWGIFFCFGSLQQIKIMFHIHGQGQIVESIFCTGSGELSSCGERDFVESTNHWLLLLLPDVQNPDPQPKQHIRHCVHHCVRAQHRQHKCAETSVVLYYSVKMNEDCCCCCQPIGNTFDFAWWAFSSTISYERMGQQHIGPIHWINIKLNVSPIDFVCPLSSCVIVSCIYLVLPLLYGRVAHACVCVHAKQSLNNGDTNTPKRINIINLIYTLSSVSKCMSTTSRHTAPPSRMHSHAYLIVA